MNKHDDFDYEKLLSLLPWRELLKPVDFDTAKYPKWCWPALISYNGFTSDERIQMWQRMRYLFRVGAIERPISCDVCSGTNQVKFHSENYFEFRMATSLCKSCHTILHQRFRSPDRWCELLSRSKVAEETWYSILPTFEIDLASHLRIARFTPFSD